MDQNTPPEETLDEAAQAGARGAQRAGAVLCAVGARPRPRRELYGLPEADLGKFRLGPRPGGLGLFADLRWPADWPRRWSAGCSTAPARAPSMRSGLLLLGGAFLIASHAQAALAVPAQPRPLRRHRHRLHRQRAEFDPARPLVRPAAADRDGGGVFRDRRRRADPAAGVAAPDRSYRLARRLSDFRRRRAVPAGAAVAAAVAAVLHRLAASSPRRPIADFVDEGWTLAERDAPPRVLGAVLDLLLHRDRRCTRSRRRSSPI